MKALYSNQGKKIGGFAAVSIDSTDIQLVGPKGWIWECKNGRLGVAYVYRGVTEKYYYCDFKDLGRALKVIGGYTGIRTQVFLANNPNERLNMIKRRKSI